MSEAVSCFFSHGSPNVTGSSTTATPTRSSTQQSPGPCTPPPPGSQSPPGTFHPQCSANGQYQPRQCNPSTGHCWCVDPRSGQEIASTNKAPGQGQPNCGGAGPSTTVATTVPTTAGSTTAATTTRAGPTEPAPPCKPAPAPPPNSPPLVGSFNPKCSSSGRYEPRQCNPSTGHCWCVDPQTGKEIPGTNKASGQGQPDCGACHKQMSTIPAPAPPGTYVPQCDASGKYVALQVSSSTRYRWCVDTETGEEVPNTRVGPSNNQSPNCATVGVAAVAKAAVALPVAAPSPTTTQALGPSPPPPPPGPSPTCTPQREHPAPGKPVPTYTKRGWYNVTQCNPSTGACWCAIPQYGIEGNGTRKAPGSGQPVCPKCLVEQGSILENSSNPAYVPECADNGKYRTTQSSSSPGSKFCVNPDTGVEVPKTRTLAIEIRNFTCSESGGDPVPASKCELESNPPGDPPPADWSRPSCSKNALSVPPLMIRPVEYYHSKSSKSNGLSRFMYISNCIYTKWSSWSECSGSPCGQGTRTHTRKVRVPALYRGKRCRFFAQHEPCQVIDDTCPANCGEWEDWSDCAPSKNVVNVMRDKQCR